MKKLLLTVLSLIFTASMATGLAACDLIGGTQSTPNSASSSETSSSSSSVSNSSSDAEMVLTLETSVENVSMKEGETSTVTATAKADGENVNATLAWESADTEIATVSAGVITAQGVGTTTITVAATYMGKEAEKTIQVEVAENFKLQLVANDEQIKGETQTLQVTLGTSASNIEIEGTVQYSVDDTSIATIENNVLTAVSKGYVTITASYTYEGVEYKASKSIRVRESYIVEYVVDGEVVETQEVLDGETFECAVNAPVSADELQEFDKWLYNGNAYEFGTTNVEENMQLVASFTHIDLREGDTYADGKVYGAYIKNDETTSEAVVVDNVLSYTAVVEGKYYSVYLPRVNYSDYASVTYTFTTNAWTGIGFNGMNNSENDATGTITITNNNNDTYSVVMHQYISADSKHTYTGTLSLDDHADVVQGKAGLELTAYAFAEYRNVMISLPTFEKDFPVLDENKTYETGVYGAYIESDETMSEAVVKDNALSYTAVVESKYYNVYLPRVNYSDYASVTFMFTTSAWTGIGYNGMNISTNDATGTITITNNSNNTYSVVMYQYVSADSKYTYTGTISLADDADIVQGKAGLALTVHAFAAHRNITISLPTFVKEFSTLEENGTYETETYGAYVLNIETNETHTMTVNANGWLDYELPGDGKTYNVYLPRVNYSAYSTVTFEWTGGSWMVSGLIGQNVSGISQGTESKGVITITNNGDGTLTVVMQDTTLEKEYTYTVTDADIINGQKVGIGVFAKMGDPYRHIRISVPTFTALGD